MKEESNTMEERIAKECEDLSKMFDKLTRQQQIQIKELTEFYMRNFTKNEIRLAEESLVGMVKRDLKARMSHEDYEPCATCDETLYHLECLLSTKPKGDE